MSELYSVYALLRADGSPFYIGASCDVMERYRNHVYDKKKRVDGGKPQLKLIKKGLSKIAALEMEREIIAGIGLDQLANENNGVGKITVSAEEWLRAGGCRSARGLLNWSMTDLAEAAGTDLWTIIDFELGTRRNVRPETVQQIRIALEVAGVMFDGNGGVKLRKDRRR